MNDFLHTFMNLIECDKMKLKSDPTKLNGLGLASQLLQPVLNPKKNKSIPPWAHFLSRPNMLSAGLNSLVVRSRDLSEPWGVEERDGIRLGDYWEQREVLWFLDWFQRMYVPLQRAQRLRSSPRRLSRVPSPFQRGLFRTSLQFYSFAR